MYAETPLRNGGYMEYLSRICDEELAFRLESKGAVLVEGLKWCGKTTTAERQAKSTLYLQDPARKSQYLQLAEYSPSHLLAGDAPRLIDEWQLAPKLWPHEMSSSTSWLVTASMQLR